MAYYVSSGVTSTGVKLSNHFSMDVYDGGTANGTTIDHLGRLYVSSGGTANGTTVNGDHIGCGYLYVLSGGTANFTTVNGGYYLGGGCLVVSSGGTANSTTVNSRGNLVVSSGGTALNVVWTPFNGYVYAADGAIVTYASPCSGVYFGSSFGASDTLLSSAMVLTGINMSDHNSMYVMSGGTANSTTVNSRGNLVVLIGGTANSTTVNSSGSMTVQYGGTANEITVNSGGELEVYGGMANSTTVNYSASMYVSSGGTANSTTVNSRGNLVVLIGGTANSTTVNSYGYLYVSSGGTANDTTVNNNGYLYVSSGGTANDTTVNNNGYLYVSSGGTASIVFNPWGGSISAEAGATVTSQISPVYYGNYAQGIVSRGSMFDGLTVASGMSALVYSGGTANSTTVNSRGYLYVSDGGTANSTTVNYRASMYVSSGGTANSTTVNEGGYLHVSSGGSANQTTVNDEGNLTVSSGGTANGTTVNSRGNLVVLIGGTANSTTVNSGGRLIVLSGGTANSTTVNSGGDLDVSRGGTANAATVKEGGDLNISSGGTALQVAENGGYVAVADGANVTFAPNSFSGLVLSSYQSATVHSGTTANETTINADGRLSVSSGGTANRTVVNSYGWLVVSRWGTALQIKENGGYVEVADGANVTFAANSFSGLVLAGGQSATVHSGTTANSTTVNEGGYLVVSSGGTANNTVNSYGYLYVSSGGTANNTVNGGYLYVSSGGTVNSATVNSYGYLVVSSGGTALNVAWTPFSGRVDAADGAIVTYARQCSGVYFGSDNTLLSSAMIFTGINVDSYISMYVMSGGTANETTVNSGGELEVYGGMANSTTVSGWSARMTVFGGGTANETTVNSGGELLISNGGTANETTVDSGGVLYVSSGGTANETTVNAHGSMTVSSGGTINSTIVNSAGNLTVRDGTTTEVVLSRYAGFNMDSGATASGLHVLSRGSAAVSNSLLYNVDLHSSARLSCFGNTVVSGGQVNSDAQLFVGSRTVVSDIAVTRMGTLFIANGGTASDTRLSDDGRLIILGEAYGISAAGASICLGKSSFAAYNEAGWPTSNSFNGDVHASRTSLDSSWMLVYHGASATETEVTSNSWLHVYWGGSAVKTEIASSGYLTLHDSATADTVNLHSGGYMRLYTGSIVKGNVNIGGEVTVWSAGTSATEDVIRAYGAKINFLLNERQASDISIISNLGMIMGATYFVTLSANQQNGSYKLADGAKDFTGSITVKTTAGTQFGTISVGNTLTIGSRTCTLSKNNGTLMLTVSGFTDAAPAKPVVNASITEPTNKNVTVTAAFSANSVKKEYSLDNDTWTAYTTGIVFTDNGTVWFRGTDAAGNVSDVASYAVTNIDKTAPDKPTSFADIIAATNKDITVSATFSFDSVKKEYSLDNRTWSAYTGGIKLATNGTVFFRGTDAAGNVSPVGSYQVTNIDKDLPDNPTTSAATTIAVISGLQVHSRESTVVSNSLLYNVDLHSRALLSCLDGTVLSGGVIGSDAQLFLGSGAEGSALSVSRMGTLYVDNGGAAYDTRLEDDGRLIVLGEAYGISAAGASICLGHSTFAAYNEAGWPTSNSFNEDVHASRTSLDSSWMLVYYGASATETEVTSNSWMHVYWGGSAVKTEIASSGYLTLHDSATADTVNLHSGGYMRLYTGSIVKGSVNVGGEVTVWSAGTSATEDVIRAYGANINFLLNERQTSDAAIISNLGMIMGATYFVTLSANQQSGSYKLADGAADFTGNITVKTTAGTQFGTISVGNTLTNGGRTCTLSKNNGTLILTVSGKAMQDTTPPVKPTASADITSPTNRDVTVTAAFSEDSVQKEYSLDNRIWSAYTTGIRFTQNGTVYFRGIDAAGNVSEVTSYAVTNIDRSVSPTRSTAGDLNADGRADIVMTIAQDGHAADGSTGAWLIQSDQTAAWGDLSQRNAGWEIFGMGHTDTGKATTDVYVRSTNNVVGAWTTDNDGRVNGWETIGEFSRDTQIVGLGDFNGNGQTDLLLRNTNGAVGCFFTGGETTGWNYFQSLGDEWKLCAVGDLNGDGRDDVVLKHDAGFAGSWLTQADGTMAWADLDTLPDGFAIVGSGDFDGDGTDDVLLQKGSYYGAWLVQNGNAAGWMGLGDLPGVSVEQIADFDGDGADDLRVRTTAGDLGAQLVKGADTLVWKYYGSVGDEWSTSLAAL